jgi:hypothetical protein
VTENLQRWLAIEHEAMWLYGLIGGRFEAVREPARIAWQDHRDVRDQLNERIRAAGETPVGPALGYGRPVTTQRRARKAAQDVEQRIAQACVPVVASASDRRLAVLGLRAAARHRVTWGGRPQAFPGLG